MHYETTKTLNKVYKLLGIKYNPDLETLLEDLYLVARAEEREYLKTKRDSV